MKYQSSNTKMIFDFDFEDRRKRYKCPECSDQRSKKDNKDLEYFTDTKRAYCFHCNTTFFEYKVNSEEKTYTIPEWKNITKLTDKSVQYFTGRMISQNTLNKMKVYSDSEWMPQFEKIIEVICFPYFRNEHLVNIKYRAPQKKFKVVSNAELIWYNFDAIINAKDLIICEGEIDALTFIENGFDNVVSVPNGAKNTSFIDSSIFLFDNIEQIYLATDVDTPGIELKDELIRRFGSEKCLSVNFKDCKDANEYFCKYGGIEFKDLISNAKSIPIDGNIEISSFYNEIIDLYENGLQPGANIEMPEIDKYCTWELGRLAIVTGRPGSGKSEFVDFILSRLNLLYNWKVAYFTPENYPLKYHYAKLHEKFSGSHFKKETDRTDFLSIYEHIKDNFFYILNEKDLTIDSIIKCAKSYVKQKGIKVLVIDPYNKLDHQQKRTETETQYISRFLDTLVNFARLNNVLVFLIAHPVKLQKDEIPSLYSISGSANFYNKTDYGLTVHRVFDGNGLMTNTVEIHFQKIKFKHLGSQGISLLSYNMNNGRFDIEGIYDNKDYIANKHFKNYHEKEQKIDFWDDERNYNPNQQFESSHETDKF
jgi:twinkle protein